MIETLAQCIGFVGTLMIIISYQQRERKKILFYQILAGAVFGLHFVLLGKYTGCIMNLIGAVRAFVYSNSDKKWARTTLWPAAFFVVFSVAGIMTWDNIWSLFPMLAMMLMAVTTWLEKPQHVRWFTFPASPLWLTYNIASRSYAGITTEIFVMASLSTAIIRYDILKRERKKK